MENMAVTHDSEHPNEWDSSLLDYEEFIEYFFGEGDAQRYERHVDLSFVQNPTRIVEHIQKLCRSFPAVAARYTLKQLDAGLWRVLGPDVDLSQLLFDSEFEVSLDLRIETIKSMWHVYNDFVAPNSLEVGQNSGFFFMWWDQLCNGPWFAARIFDDEKMIYENLDAHCKALLDATVWTCREMLKIDDQFVWICAFHGLGHSHHPEVPLLIDSFLKEKDYEIPGQTVEWMKQCKTFQIM